MFGFNSPASPSVEEGEAVVLKLDNKQRNLIAKAFGYKARGAKSSSQSRAGKKTVKFSRREKKELREALKLK